VPEPKEIIERMKEMVAARDEAAVCKLAALYYQQEGVQVLPPSLQFTAATCLAKAEKYKEAVAYYRRFLRFYRGHPKAGETRYRVGALYARFLDRPDEAKRFLELAAERGDPKVVAKARKALGQLVGGPGAGPDGGDEGPFTVVLAREQPINVSDVGKPIAMILGKNLADVTRQIKASRSIVAMDLDRGEANAVNAVLSKHGVKGLVLSRRAFPPPPFPELVVRARFDEFDFELATAGGLATGDYDKLRLIAAAQMRLSRQKQGSRRTRTETDEAYAGSRVFTPGEGDGGKYDRTEKDFHVVDVFLRTPPRRLRLDERTLEITEQSTIAMNRRINIRMLGARLAGFASRTPANKALGLFTQRGSVSTAWEEFTFDTEPAFDLYCRWLLAVNKGL